MKWLKTNFEFSKNEYETEKFYLIYSSNVPKDLFDLYSNVNKLLCKVLNLKFDLYKKWIDKIYDHTRLITFDF